MAIEKKWPAVAPRLFTTNGTAQGVITLENTKGFKVKQKVVLVNPSLPVATQSKVLQVKRVTKTTLIVGPIPSQVGQSQLSVREDISSFTTAVGAYVYAEEQDKANLKPDDIIQAVYDQEPAVAIRTVFVDQEGDYYDDGNPLPIAFDGTISVGNVTIQDDDGDELEINSDGSLNVNIVNAVTDNSKQKNTYNQASAVAPGVETTLVTYIVPMDVTSAFLQRISVSGENVARYQVFVNGVVFDTRRTYYGGSFNEYFEFAVNGSDGASLEPGDTVAVKVLHDRVYVGDFHGRIQVLEKT